jgi:hypothetical protein
MEMAFGCGAYQMRICKRVYFPEAFQKSGPLTGNSRKYSLLVRITFVPLMKGYFCKRVNKNNRYSYQDIYKYYFSRKGDKKTRCHGDLIPLQKYLYYEIPPLAGRQMTLKN